jgi:DNA-binding transcriptional ArsR family regulator
MLQALVWFFRLLPSLFLPEYFLNWDNLNPCVKMKEKHNGLPLDPNGIGKTALIVRALNHPLRQRILKAIHRAGSINVTDLCTTLDEIQPLVSHNLAVLRKYGFVQATTEGRSVIYSVNHQRVERVQQVVRKLLSALQQSRATHGHP